MKIRLSKSYTTYEIYDTIEINKEDYPELEGMTDQEALEYLNENMHDMPLVDGEESSISDEFEFGREVIKEKTSEEEYELILVGE
jgi:hypothetical protein